MKCTIFQKHSHVSRQSLSTSVSLQSGPEYIMINEVSIGCDPEMPSHLFAQFLLAPEALLLVRPHRNRVVVLRNNATHEHDESKLKPQAVP